MEAKKKNNQCVLITGATDGIGLELARCFAKDGYELFLVSRTRSTLEDVAADLAREFSVSTRVFPCDLMEPDAAFTLYEEVSKTGRQIDVLVNNAGQGVYGAFTGTDITEELQIIQLNIISLVILTKLFLKEMVLRDSGKILQLASIASKAPAPYLSVYAGTKAFVYNFTQGLINELKDSKVTITALLPGPTDTDFFNKAGATGIVAVQEGGLADPADVAKDGYQALMDGESKVISGLKNKANMALGNFMTDEALADMVRKQHELSDKSFEVTIEKDGDQKQ